MQTDLFLDTLQAWPHVIKRKFVAVTTRTYAYVSPVWFKIAQKRPYCKLASIQKTLRLGIMATRGISLENIQRSFRLQYIQPYEQQITWWTSLITSKILQKCKTSLNPFTRLSTIWIIIMFTQSRLGILMGRVSRWMTAHSFSFTLGKTNLARKRISMLRPWL